MALADILNRIDVDANSEAQALIDAAQAEADRLLADARAHADEAADAIARSAAREASLEAATLLANARLEARDALLSAKREVLDGALVRLGEHIVAMPDAALHGVSRPRHRGRCPRRRDACSWRLPTRAGLPDLRAAVEAAAGRDLGLVFDEAAADIEHGVMLLGERDSVDLSIAGIIDGQREELLMRLAALVFGDEGALA